MRDLLHEAVELGGGGLIDAGFLGEAADADCLEDPQGAEGVDVGGVFRGLETHGHMALSAEVVDLIGLYLLDDSLEVAAVGEIAVMEGEAWIDFVRVLIEVIDAGGVEGGGASFDAVDGVALLKEELSKIGAVLAGDPSDEGDGAVHASDRAKVWQSPIIS